MKKLIGIVTAAFLSISSISYNLNAALNNTQNNIETRKEAIRLEARITLPDNDGNDRLNFLARCFDNTYFNVIGSSKEEKDLEPIIKRINNAFYENNYSMIIIEGVKTMENDLNTIDMTKGAITIIYKNKEVYHGKIHE